MLSWKKLEIRWKKGSEWQNDPPKLQIWLKISKCNKYMFLR